MTEDELLEVFGGAWSNEGFLSREHELARLEAGRSTLRRFHHAQQASDAVVPTYVEREFDFRLGGDRIRGRWDRVDILAVGGDPRGRGVAAGSARGAGSGPSDDVTESAAILPTHGPDVATPTLDLLGREIVVVTDYKSGDVRDPALARQRARDSLQLQIYAMAYEAMAGRLPDAVQLHFLDSGLVGRVDVDPRRQARGRARIESAADGIRAGEFRATPAPLACSWCPYRQICPSSVAP
jgi:DNA helicase-2/ATP-dependent DNA helicase PcrA